MKDVGTNERHEFTISQKLLKICFNIPLSRKLALTKAIKNKPVDIAYDAKTTLSLNSKTNVKVIDAYQSYCVEKCFVTLMM